MSPHCRHHTRGGKLFRDGCWCTSEQRHHSLLVYWTWWKRNSWRRLCAIRYFKNIPSAKLKGDKGEESPAPAVYRAGSHSPQAFPLSSPRILTGHGGFLETLTPPLPSSSLSPCPSEVDVHMVLSFPPLTTGRDKCYILMHSSLRRVVALEVPSQPSPLQSFPRLCWRALSSRQLQRVRWGIPCALPPPPEPK